MWAEPHFSKNRRGRLFINVTSLVDVLFILLIFFALSTTFERLGTLDLNLPKAKSAKPLAAVQSHEIAIRASGKVVLDGKVLTEKQMMETVGKWSMAEKRKPVVLKANYEIEYGRVVRILDKLREAGVMKIQVLTKNK